MQTICLHGSILYFAMQHWGAAPPGPNKKAAEIWDVAVYSSVNISVGMQPAAATAVNLPDADLESD
jgi:hypothetical protein